MNEALFLYGTLCHPGLRDVVLGPGHGATEARLEGYRIGVAAGQDYPVMLPGTGAVPGLLVEGLDATALGRADFFELGFGYRRVPVAVTVAGRGTVAATAYLAGGAAPEIAGPWDLAAWAERSAATWVTAAADALAGAGGDSPETLAARWPMIKLRAASRLRAAAGATRAERADFTAARDVELVRERRPYTEYFSLEDHDLRFRRFDGDWSPVVRRAGFIGGDAATVLPYDPGRDAVLVVEQFRAGPYLRGDPRPWTLEPIAGRIDPGESPQACARREAREETGLELGALHPIADFYASPGAATEFVYAFVGLADLDGRAGGVGGEAAEDEDIHAHVLAFDRLMALVASGEAGTGPLILSAYWLALNRARLRA